MISGVADLPCGKADGGGYFDGNGDGEGLCPDTSVSRGTGAGAGSGAERFNSSGIEDAACLDGKEILFAAGDTAYILWGHKIDFAIDHPPGEFWWTIEEAEAALALRLLND